MYDGGTSDPTASEYHEEVVPQHRLREDELDAGVARALFMKKSDLALAFGQPAHPGESGLLLVDLGEPKTGAWLRIMALRPARRPSQVVGLTAYFLPARDRDRWAEEWAREWQDMAEQPFVSRVAFLLRLFTRTGPALAWVLRVQQRREAA
ncbi:hypothetical protein ACFQ69_24840 [Streptomyces sp. NPDC056470]|uniref:hypothetical protein n=1 Tax=Streptomyces sp. NPDC056470 TaxID=3345831 RepID=UPI0036AF6410